MAESAINSLEDAIGALEEFDGLTNQLEEAISSANSATE